MKILKKYEEAIEIVKPFLTEKKLSNPWSETFESAETTFKYIFDLSHNCYVLLCPTNEILKFEFSTTSSLLKKYLTLKKLPSKKQKTFKKNQWRIMQCVIKPFKDTGGDILFPKFIKKLKIPDGVYILSLNDAQLLKKNLNEPWFGKNLLKYQPPFLPMFSYSGHKDYFDVPLPTRDEIEYAMKPFEVIDVPWENKMSKAVFRGSLTGCGTTESTNQRIKLASMKSELLDVGLTKSSSQNYRFENGVSELKTYIEPVGKLDMFTEQIKYKFIIHVDGNVLAYRLIPSMLTGSLIIRIKSPYIHWLDSLLKDGKHFISVKEDLSDLAEKIDWCLNNDNKCKKIADTSKNFAKKVLDMNFIKTKTEKIFSQLRS
jgi:hypothetical protein